MGFWPFNTVGKVRQTRRVKRAGERFLTDLLSSELGDVADLSADGLRVRASGRVKASVGQVVPLTIRWAGCRVAVKGRVAWMTRAEDGGREIGVQFVEMSPRLRAALGHLGQFGFVPGTSGESESAAAPPRGCRGKPVPDYYQVLGVSAEASAAEIRQAYYRLSRHHHPDKSDDPAAARKFQALADAYRALRDPESRRRYDEARGETVGAA